MDDNTKRIIAELVDLLEDNVHHWEEERNRSSCNSCDAQWPRHRDGCKTKLLIEEAKKLIAG